MVDAEFASKRRKTLKKLQVCLAQILHRHGISLFLISDMIYVCGTDGSDIGFLPSVL
jgi:MFS-type transporter involved in bile tolerance (Atg22 family)